MNNTRSGGMSVECVCVCACIVDMCARARKQMSELNTKCVSHSAVRLTYL